MGFSRIPSRLSIAFALLAASQPALAEDDYGRPGFYLGAGAMGVEYTDLDEQQFVDDVDTTWAVDAFAGYRINRWIAAEVELELAPDGEFEGLGRDADLLTLAGTANLKLIPLAGRIQPYVFFGPGFLYVEVDTPFGDDDDTDFAARFGGGVDVYLTRNVVVYARSSYLYPPVDDLDDFDYVSFGGGLQYRF